MLARLVADKKLLLMMWKTFSYISNNNKEKPNFILPKFLQFSDIEKNKKAALAATPPYVIKDSRGIKLYNFAMLKDMDFELQVCAWHCSLKCMHFALKVHIRRSSYNDYLENED